MARMIEDVDGVLVPAPEPVETTRSRDSYIVDAEPVARVLHAFAREWEQLHPRDAALRDRVAARRPVVTPVTAVEWLAAETVRIDPKKRGIPARTIENFLRHAPDGSPAPKYPTTDLRIADALLIAAGRPEMVDKLEPRKRSPRNQALTGAVEPPSWWVR